MTEFKLCRASRSRLEGVHSQLGEVVDRAIELTTQDFSVTDGLSTLERRKALKASGTSNTLNSMHLKQPDGWVMPLIWLPISMALGGNVQACFAAEKMISADI